MTHADPRLVARNALSGINIGISVSDSVDLARLGLDQRHLDLAVAEIVRAVVIAEGTIVYGGRLRPSGFTQQLINEIGRFGTSRHSLTLCVALPEHTGMSDDELRKIDAALGTSGRLVTLDRRGDKIRWQDREPSDGPVTEETRVAAYSGLRRYMTNNTRARIVVGGQLRNYRGAMPGVIEEVLFSVEAGQPVYLAGGFGGAAAAVARKLDPDSFRWLPDGIPAGEEDRPVREALDLLASVAAERGWSVRNDGLSEDSRQLLYASHRPGEVASLAVFGLAVLFGTGRETPS